MIFSREDTAILAARGDNASGSAPLNRILSLVTPIYGSESDDIPPGEAGQFDNPFNDAVDAWRDAGWLGTIPLPPKKKSPPPNRFTGRKPDRILYPDDEQISAWVESGTYNEGTTKPQTVGNIGLALGFPVTVNGTEYEVCGIDVDDYVSGNKTKYGGKQLKRLESELGPLPDTWISSARSDGTSGIRYVLVPTGLAFVGQADADIEVVQRNHRYAVTWPSVHPDGGIYHLYPPGVAPDGVNFSDEIPDVTALPLLPDKWVDHLTNGKTPDSEMEIDRVATLDELDVWADEQFHAGDESSACENMCAVVTKWCNQIASEATSHDKIRGAHWEIVNLGAEGCTGWSWGIEAVETRWIADVIARDKREAGELRREVWRSRTNAFRKVKAKVDQAAKSGARYTPPQCVHSPQMKTTGQSNMTAPQQNKGTQTGGRPVDQIHSGQIRMAHRLAKAQTNRLLYVHGIGWHYWDRTRWQADDSEARVKRAAMQVIAEAITQTIGNPTDEAKRLRSDARKCESASGLDGMIRIARALKPFAATVADIDADPYLLNVANGTVDLRTGELSAHNPADRITKICRGAYLADADDPARFGTNWTAFLERVQPDDDMRGFAQRLIGVGLIGRIVEHILPILVGTGANGKSVFCEAIQFALGDYAITAEPDLLMHRDGGHPTGEMDLRGCRWVIVSESEKDRRLAETTVKRLTADATVRARKMRQDFVEFKASHTLMLVTNHKPKVSGDDQAIWRRLRVVPFNVQIPRIEQDTGLGEKLQLEADAVISWAIAGLVAYWQHGLDEPRQVQSATAMYHRESDAIGRFIADRCVTGPKRKVEPKRLHAVWCAWQAEDGCEAVGLRAFNAAMEERGYATGKPSNGKRWRLGIGLAADDPSSQT